MSTPEPFCNKCFFEQHKVPFTELTLAQALTNLPPLPPTEFNLPGILFQLVYGGIKGTIYGIVAATCTLLCQQEPSQPPRVAPLIIVDPATNTVTIFKPINETAQESVDQSLPETVTENAAQFSSKTIQEQITENLNITTFFS